MIDDKYDENEELEDNDDFSEDDIDLDDIDDNNEDSSKEDSSNEDSSNEDSSKEDDFDFKFLSQQNKHKLEGKHSLERDVLFTGKLEEKKDEDFADTTNFFYSEEVSIETGSQFEFESRNHEDYISNLNLEKDIYDLLTDETDLDFNQNRRKPKREDFNAYYELLQKNLKHKYTNCEIFVALSYYFTDNIFNMYKLLDRKHAATIIVELKNKGYLDNLGNINFV